MNRHILCVLVGVLLLVPAGAGVLGGQQAPKPPEPPAIAEPSTPPEAPTPPPDAAMLLVEDGGTWLGVRLSEVTSKKASELKLAGEYGARVIEVESDSPAAKAGLEKNDVIVEFAGEKVRSVAQLQRLVHETPAGRTVTLQVSRAGQVRNLSVKLEEGWDRLRMPHIPEVHIPDVHPEVRIPDFGYYFFHNRGTSLGITGEELTRQLADYFGVKQGKGVLVREVKEGGPAEKAGLKAGDVIVRVDGKEVASVEELRNVLPNDLEGEKKVNLSVVRDRHEQTISVELEPSRRVPLRRAERLEMPKIDLGSLKEQVAEYQRQLGPLQEELRRQQSELREQARRLSQDLKRALEEEQGKLKEQLQELHRQQLRNDDAVI